MHLALTMLVVVDDNVETNLTQLALDCQAAIDIALEGCPPDMFKGVVTIRIKELEVRG